MIEPGEIPMNREVGNYVAMFWAPTLQFPLNRLLLWARGTGACMQR